MGDPFFPFAWRLLNACSWKEGWRKDFLFRASIDASTAGLQGAYT